MSTLNPGAQRYSNGTDRSADPGRPIWSGPTPHTSVIKWYDPHPQRRFGFIVAHDGGDDIYFNWTTLLKNGIAENAVFPDMDVRYSFSEPKEAGKKRSVVHMKLELE